MNARNSHDLFAFYLFLESCTINHRMSNSRVKHTHQVQRLHNVRTIVAGQADIRFKVVFAFNAFDLIDDILFYLWSSSAHLEQS
ncbi:hypothetical protein D3C78_856240 [compost metagenome]